MKLKIMADDGSIHGWFVAFCETLLVYGTWAISLFMPKVADAWAKNGSFIQTIYLGTFGVWLAFKGWKYSTDSKTTQAQGEGSAKA